MDWKFSTSTWGFVARPNSQLTGYAKGASAHLGREVSRVVLHTCGLFVSSSEGVVPGKKKGDSGRSVHSREPVDLEGFDFEEWERDVQWKWRELCRYSETGYWPKRTQSCGDYGGCPFVPLCAAPPEQRELFVMSNFVEKGERNK